MTTVTFPKLGPGTLTFGAATTLKDFSARVKSVTITPELKDDGGVTLLNGDVTNEENATFGTLSAEMYQDFDPTGLVAWTYSNAGKEMPFTFIPLNSGNGMKITGNCKIKPVVIGGEVKKANTTTLSFPIVEALPVIAAK